MQYLLVKCRNFSLSTQCIYIALLIFNLQGQVLEYLNLFCKQNSYGVYCLELVDEFDSGTLQLPYEDIDVSADNKNSLICIIICGFACFLCCASICSYKIAFPLCCKYVVI